MKMKTAPKFMALAFAATFSLGSVSVFAQDGIPKFFQDTIPESYIQSVLQAYAALHGPDSALDEKTRQLIALGVSAQIPCEYCVHAHYSNAVAAGATADEIKEAVGVASFVRMFSTNLYGSAYDLESFKQEVNSRNN